MRRYRLRRAPFGSEPQGRKQSSRAGFSFLEMLIVLAILGTLAAIVILGFRDPSDKAKEAAAKENLQKLRNAIELYAVQHKGVPPGYPEGDVSKTPLSTTFTQQLCNATNSDGEYAPSGTAGYPLGPYLPEIPENPFNNKNTVKVLGNAVQFSASATDGFGWICKPLTKTIRLDYPATDSEGARYYDY